MAEQEVVESALLDALIAEIKEVQSHPTTAAMTPGEVLQRFDTERGPAEMSYHGVNDDSDRAVTVYSTKDGMSSEILVNMLAKTLRRRWQAESDVPQELWGRPVFSIRPKPLYTLKTPDIKCFMHVESEERELLDTIGLGGRVCRKASISDEFSKEMHEQHRHRNEKSVHERYLTKTRESVTDEREKAMLDAQLALAQVVKDMVWERKEPLNEAVAELSEAADVTPPDFDFDAAAAERDEESE